MGLTTPVIYKRGVLYMVWGTSHDHLLERSIASLRQFHPDLPIHVHRVEPKGADVASSQVFLEKAAMLNITPFNTTLFLDADTVVLGSLDFGFEKAEQYGLACCICECPWARRYKGLRQRGDMIEYNTGVLFFTRQVQPLMYMWERLVCTVDSSVEFYHSNGQKDVMDYNDQAAFASTVDMTGVQPFVLPLNWNFRPKWHRLFFGPVRIWHDPANPPGDLINTNKYHEDKNAIIVDVRID